MPSEFRLFVSSTFRDLKEEREQLVKKIFPRVRALCRERAVEFSEIDLRWGITPEEARTGKTLRICLDEIDRCKPYIIGILGSRYGWIPTIEDLAKDPALLTEHPTLAEAVRQQKSIVELEFTFGAIAREESKGRAFFYYREEPADTSEDRVRLTALRDRLITSGYPVRSFSEPEELGDLVFADLSSIVNRDWPISKELTPVEAERAAHEAFSMNRRRAYVANPDYLAAFNEHVRSEDVPLIVWGKSGMGKSALMAYLTHASQDHHPEAFVIPHFVGAAATGTDPDDVIRQVMLEIKQRYGFSDDPPQEEAKLIEEFPLWLARVPQDEKLILAIDAVNQLTGVALEMHWLPEFIPSNVRLVVSTTPETPLTEMRKRGWKELEIEPLSAKQRKAIAKDFLSHYHKSLDETQLSAISNDKKSESPLFLRTLLEEMRVFGVHEEVSKQLRYYLDSADERELFQRVLGRMELDHGEENVRKVTSAIWASRMGLSERELLEVTGMAQMPLSEVLIAMEYHLMQREGLYTFFHNYLREAVGVRYLPAPAAQREQHQKLGVYFSTREYGPRRRDEEAWQYEKSGDIERLEITLKDPKVLEQYWSAQKLLDYLAHARDNNLTESILAFCTQWLLTDIERIKGTEETKPIEIVTDLFIADGHYAECYDLLFKLLDVKGLSSRQRYKLLVSAATVGCHVSKYEEAIDICNTAIGDTKAFEADTSTGRLEVYRILANAYYWKGDFDKAEHNARAAYELGTSKSEIPRLEAARDLKNIGAIKLGKGENEEALELLTESLALYQKLLGASHPDSLSCLQNVALALARLQQFEASVLNAQTAYNGMQLMLGPKHPETIRSLINLGRLCRTASKIDDAEHYLLDALKVSTEVFGEESIDTAFAGTGLGLLYLDAKRGKESLAMYSKFSPIVGKLLGKEHPDYIRLLSRIEEASKLASA